VLLFFTGPAVAGRPVGALAVWARALGTALAAGAFAAAAFAGHGATPTRRRRVTFAIRGYGTAAAGTLVALIVVRPRVDLPSEVPAAALARPLVVGAPLLLATQLAAAILFALATVGFVRRCREQGDAFLLALALAMPLGCGAAVHYFLFPSPYPDYVFTGDVFRLMFFAVLLAGVLVQIGSYQRVGERLGVARERERLARELHDGPVQELALLGLLIDRLAARVQDPIVTQLDERSRAALAEWRAAIAGASADGPLHDLLDRTARGLTGRHRRRRRRRCRARSDGRLRRTRGRGDDRPGGREQRGPARRRAPRAHRGRRAAPVAPDRRRRSLERRRGRLSRAGPGNRGDARAGGAARGRAAHRSLAARHDRERPDMSTPLTARVLIADDHVLLREALAAVIDDQPDFDVVAQADDGAAAIELALREDIDLALLDISMPKLTGIDAARHISAHRPATRVVFLTMHEDTDLLYQALRAGASGYVVKSAGTHELIEAARAALRGRVVLYPREMRALAKSFLAAVADGQESAPDVLTDREQEVLKLVAEGHSSDQVAAILHISAKTVARHRQNIFAKLGMSDRVELTRYAIRRGLVTP
jgi:DNA-binding NarL/FixJ family response regulator